MKKIIVTGYNGFIGTHLVRLLKEAGYYVIGIDTNYFGEDCSFSKSIKPDQVIKKDIRLIEKKEIDSVYAICHLAALSNDPLGALNENLTYDINYRSSLRLAQLARITGVRKYIFSASCSMYGIADGEIVLNEEASFAPVTAYAKSKVYSEKDIKPLANEEFCVTFLRNATAYGLSPKLRVDLVVNNLIGWAVTTGKIRIMSDGTPWRPLIHAEDIARAFIAVIEAPENIINKKSFNVGISSENYQIKDIAEIIGRTIPGCKVEITGEHGSDSRSYKVDFTKIASELPGFSPQWILPAAVENIYQGFLHADMNQKKFSARYFIRLKQLQYLLENRMITKDLLWPDEN